MNQALITLTYDSCKRSCINPEDLRALDNQSVLVSGGTGFIGKWMAEMIAFLNSSYGFNIKLYLLARDIERFKNDVPHLASKPFVELIEQDIRNLHSLPAEVKWVIHAAGSPDNREHVTEPLKVIDTIYKGTTAILDACSRLGELRKLIYISSNQVYGVVESSEPIKESVLGRVDCDSVNTAYAEGKRMAETLCAIYRNQQKMPINIVRPFAFIGPYQGLEKPWAINNFVRDALLGGPVRILGDGATIRSYLYGSDLAFWLLKTLTSGKAGQTYNLGSPEPVSLNDLALRITNIVDNRIEIISKSAKETYSKSSVSVPDITKIKKDLNLEITFNLEDALEETIAWHRISKS